MKHTPDICGTQPMVSSQRVMDVDKMWTIATNYRHEQWEKWCNSRFLWFNALHHVVLRVQLIFVWKHTSAATVIPTRWIWLLIEIFGVLCLQNWAEMRIVQPAREARRLAQRAERPLRGLSALWASRRASRGGWTILQHENQRMSMFGDHLSMTWRVTGCHGRIKQRWCLVILLGITMVIGGTVGLDGFTKTGGRQPQREDGDLHQLSAKDQDYHQPQGFRMIGPVYLWCTTRRNNKPCQKGFVR